MAAIDTSSSKAPQRSCAAAKRLRPQTATTPPTTLQASTPRAPNHLFRLSPELRDMIYDEGILDPSEPLKILARIRRPISYGQGLLCTCREIHREFSIRISTRLLDRDPAPPAYNKNLDFRGLLSVLRKVADKNASSLRRDRRQERGHF